jgi:hypothetical protein
VGRDRVLSKLAWQYEVSGLLADYDSMWPGIARSPYLRMSATMAIPLRLPPSSRLRPGGGLVARAGSRRRIVHGRKGNIWKRSRTPVDQPARVLGKSPNHFPGTPQLAQPETFVGE